MKKCSAADNLITSLDRLLTEKITADDLEQARLSLLDYLGVCLAGAAASRRPGGVLQEQSADGSPFDAGSFLPLGLASRTSLTAAAFLNGFNGHCLELDDGHRRGMCHAGVPVLSAVLPIAAAEHIPGGRVLQAILVGYETTLRLACAVQPSHKVKGYHTSATCGTLGAAAACACAAGYDRQQLKRTLSAAVTNTGGTLALQDDRSEMKPVNLGRAAAAGVLSAQIGRLELECPDDAIGGDRGFLELYAENPKLEYFAADDSCPPMIESIYRKLYAACRHAHPPADCAFAIAAEHAPDPEHIERILVRTHRLAIKGHDHTDFDNASAARLSIPYAVACALTLGTLSQAAYAPEHLDSRALRRLCDRTVVTEDPDMTRALPDQRGASLRIVMDDGTVYEHRVPLPKGEPELPLTPAEIESKTTGLLREAGFPAGQIRSLIEDVHEFDDHHTHLYETLNAFSRRTE
ncbi:MAG: MmgE/PrpD family protein [Anaerovoracaceae bacterium]|jgi:2-methylcitrate dehydratase PrpD